MLACLKVALPSPKHAASVLAKAARRPWMPCSWVPRGRVSEWGSARKWEIRLDDFQTLEDWEQSAVTSFSVLAFILFIMSSAMQRLIDWRYANLLPNWDRERELPSNCVCARLRVFAFGCPPAEGMTRLRWNLFSALNKPRAKCVCSVHACDQTRTQTCTDTNCTRHASERGKKYRTTGTNEDGRSKLETKRGMISVCPARP